MGSVNKVILLGHLGKDPEVKTMNGGGKVCNLSVATSQSWTDKRSGERQEKTEWHRVVIFNESIIKYVEGYAQKGTQVYLEGELQTRKWQNDKGEDRFSTEIKIGPFNSVLTIVGGGAGKGGERSGGTPEPQRKPPINDEIPF